MVLSITVLDWKKHPHFFQVRVNIYIKYYKLFEENNFRGKNLLEIQMKVSLMIYSNSKIVKNIV